MISLNGIVPSVLGQSKRPATGDTCDTGDTGDIGDTIITEQSTAGQGLYIGGKGGG